MKNHRPLLDTLRNRLLRSLWCILLLCLFLPGQTRAADEVVIVQSSGLAPYEEARVGFEQAWARMQPQTGVKSIAPISLPHFILSDHNSDSSFWNKINEKHPKVVLAIGRGALVQCEDFLDRPIVFVMVTEPENVVHPEKKSTGVSMKITPSRQLGVVGKVLPGVHAIGALYNPAQTGKWVQEALLSGVSDVQALLFRKIDATTDFPRTLDTIKRSIDAYWMLPDRLVSNPQTVRHLLQFSLDNRIPIITFSEKYLKAGAALAVTFDIEDMGAQAAEIAGRIVRGESTADIPIQAPRRIKVVANQNVLDRMGVQVDASAVTDVYQGGAQ